MRATRLALVIVLLLSGRVAASTPHLTGWYENQLSIVDYRSGLTLLDENEVRFSLEASPQSNVRLSASVLIQAFHGATKFMLADLVPDWVSDSVPDSVLLANRFALDRAFVSARWSGFNLKVGKQPLAWGTGYVWNPTEVIPAKSFLDPDYEREGQNAMRLEATWLGPALQAFFLPGSDFGRSQYLLRAEWNLVGFDMGITACRRPLTDVLAGRNWTDYLLGGQAKGEVFGLGVWSEGACHWSEDSVALSWQVCAGTDYTLACRTYLLLEYYRSSTGATGVREYDAAAWRRAVTAGSALGRDYAFGLVMQPVLGFHQVGVGAVANLNDFSAVVFPRIRFGPADDIDLDCYLLFSVGGGRTEFGGPGVNGGVVQLTFYF